MAVLLLLPIAASASSAASASVLLPWALSVTVFAPLALQVSPWLCPLNFCCGPLPHMLPGGVSVFFIKCCIATPPRLLAPRLLLRLAFFCEHRRWCARVCFSHFRLGPHCMHTGHTVWSLSLHISGALC